MEISIHIKQKKVSLEGILDIPNSAFGIVLFVHGSGSSRFSPRNRLVANKLNQSGLATLLIDLLTEEEDADYQTRFNIPLLTERLTAVVHWLKQNETTLDLPIGLFGSSTGGAAALEAAAYLQESIQSVVSRGGRPDLALASLEKVTAPTLLIVGALDDIVIELNKIAFEKLHCEKRLEIVPNATHLFEEPGCLDEVARLSKDWFQRTLHNLRKSS